MNAIKEITNLQGLSTGKNKNHCWLRCLCKQQTSCVGRRARGEDLSEISPLAIVRGPLATTQKKYFGNDGESGCGWLY